jgi:hypothetical protein
VSCLTAEQLDRLAVRPDDPAQAPKRAHVRQCADCRRRLDEARTDAALVGDIRELRECRDKVKPLADAMPDASTSVVPPSQGQVP